ncbi:MAG: alpha/beta fold hydrolase [Desulfobacterales bacterium]|nr:alpha/beta fold hydrolase [Desulfobacterales bacterium]
MNRLAYFTSGYAFKALYDLSKTKIKIHGKENLQEGAAIFVINHFTRIETLFLPYYIYQLTKKPVWSLADASLFKGILGTYLNKVGVVSTKNPDRDSLIVKSLLTGEASWIIFPEGQMVKNKKIFEDGKFLISSSEGKRRPHTGAATLALRTEFYRKRIGRMLEKAPEEAKRLLDLYQIDVTIHSLDHLMAKETMIIPVNITYYPIRARENLLTQIANALIDDMPERFAEEIMIEGTMLLSGVDVDIRLGEPIKIKDYMNNSFIESDISSRRKIDFDDQISSKPVMRDIAIQLMEKYMASIYQMTTINHDHLFASIVKQMPFEKIDSYDLKSRVYLATVLDSTKQEVFHHHSLDSNQIHLLTDDRYQRFENFMQIALEKSVVTVKDGVITKDHSKFFEKADFHQVRIVNPIAVMANEVEPLVSIQPYIRRLAWEPAFHIRRRLSFYLIEKAIQEFDKDYDEFYIQGESKSKDVGRPFLIEGNQKDIGIVLIHGYMAAPLEVKQLALFLGEKGYWVYVPRLKGHGTSPEDLASRKYMDWVCCVEEAYTIMRNICNRVVMGGFSAGAGLALDMGTRVKDITGIFAVCPPLRLNDFSVKFVPAVNTWNRFMDMVNLLSAKKEFVDNHPENPHINYFRNPISGIRELELLMEMVEGKLSKVIVPALIIQARNDPVVNPKGSYRLFELLGSQEKEYYVVNYDRHGILLGQGAERIYNMVDEFIQKLNTIFRIKG